MGFKCCCFFFCRSWSLLLSELTVVVLFVVADCQRMTTLFAKIAEAVSEVDREVGFGCYTFQFLFIEPYNINKSKRDFYKAFGIS